MAGTGRRSCKECRQAYEAHNRPGPGRRKKNQAPIEIKEPPCATCRPELMPDNFEAVAVYNRCSDQWLIAPNGKHVGLLVPSLESMIRIMDVADPLECFDQVKLIADIVIMESEKAANK